VLDPGFDVVRNDGFRYAGHKFQGAHVGANPAGQFLTLRGFGEGVVAGAQNGHEEGSLVEGLARPRIMNRDLVAGVVDKHLFARAMLVPQDHIQSPRPLAIPFAESAVAVAFRICFPILFPQQLQREVTVGLQLSPDGREVRQHRLTRLRTRPRLSGKSRF
jgi:hypothetical protein